MGIRGVIREVIHRSDDGRRPHDRQQRRRRRRRADGDVVRSDVIVGLPVLVAYPSEDDDERMMDDGRRENESPPMVRRSTPTRRTWRRRMRCGRGIGRSVALPGRLWRERLVSPRTACTPRRVEGGSLCFDVCFFPRLRSNRGPTRARSVNDLSHTLALDLLPL